MVMDIEVGEGDGEKRGGRGGGGRYIKRVLLGKGEKGVENGDGYRSWGGR